MAEDGSMAADTPAAAAPAPPPGPPQNWSEAMSQYCREKCGPGPPVDPMHRFTRRAGGFVKARERAFHPVLQQPIDDGKAGAMTERDAERLVRKVNRGMERSLTKESYIGYDPVSHRPKFGIDGADRMGGMQVPKGRRCPPPPRLTEEKPKEEGRPVRIPRRQYNIIQHRYASKHEERLRARDDAVLEHAGNITAKGRDPILGTLNDTAEESRLRGAEASRDDRRRQELHCTTMYTPSVVRRSEGHNYDIIRGWVHDVAAVDTIDRMNRRGVPHREAFRSTVSVRLADRDAQDARAAARAAARKGNPLRHRDLCRSGYDILTGSKAPPAPKPPADTPVYNLLQRTAPAALPDIPQP
eukprot:TRINITY_DN9634_c0_g2_i1.p1 TRINITY_DN9634_c0_g2~~TRINITY_DN9634_c0_g2_i1.p1  ORF type:complete len:356 (+),score=108.33 TRINITY_DN9634_c0_g2_i1:79-1146(+)